MFQSPSDIAFYLFGMPVYRYGILLSSAVAAGCFAAHLLFKKYYEKENADKIYEIAPYLIITGILGARLYYCIVNYSYYTEHPLEIFFIRQGGLSIHGMIIAGLISLYIFSKIYKIAFFKLTDTFLCAVSLAQAIGRWGNFFNSEAFGTPTDLPWKLFIPLSKRPENYINFDYFHPTFLYESILDLILFFVLVLLFKNATKKPGTITGLYLILYSIIRIFVEHLRVDSVLNIYGIPVAQILSVILIIIGSILLVIINKKIYK